MSSSEKEETEQQEQPQQPQQPQQEQIKKYRAYRVGLLDSRREVFNFIDLWEIECKIIPARKNNFEWHKQNNVSKPLVTMGADKNVIQIMEPRYYSESIAGGHAVLPVTEWKRRFHEVPSIDLEGWISESNQESDVVMVQGPIAGNAVISEVLQQTGEFENLHLSAATSNPEFDAGLDYDARHNFSRSYELIQCNRPDCSRCYAEIEILPETELFAVGNPRYSFENVEATNRYRARRKRILNQMKLMRLAMQAVEVTLVITTDEEDGAYGEG
jgi:hypothetical protein